MQRLRTVMTALQTPATFVPQKGKHPPHHYRRNSVAGDGPSVSMQAVSETAAKGVDGSLSFEDLGISCRETQVGDAGVRYEETIVHIVRNDPTGTKRLAEFFASKGLSVVTFGTASEYMAAARDDRPTCLILDLNLPDLQGLDIQSRLADRGAPPVVFVTTLADPASAVRAMKNGAIDFLTDPIDYQQLMTAVDLALVEDLERRNKRIELTSLLGRWQSLTPREKEVFHHTVAGLLNKQAAAELRVAENTYQVHRGRVMRKMEATSLADLVRMSTKLEPMLPKPCRRKTCYGVTVAVPTRTDEYKLHSRSNLSTSRESAKQVDSDDSTWIRQR
jgi:FixJ family two-component response regulator